MSGLPEFHAPTPLRHHPQDLHVIDGHEYRWVATTETGYLFSRVNEPEITEGFTFEQFDRVRRDRTYRLQRGWFDPNRSKVRLRPDPPLLRRQRPQDPAADRRGSYNLIGCKPGSLPPGDRERGRASR